MASGAEVSEVRTGQATKGRIQISAGEVFKVDQFVRIAPMKKIDSALIGGIVSRVSSVVMKGSERNLVTKYTLVGFDERLEFRSDELEPVTQDYEKKMALMLEKGSLKLFDAALEFVDTEDFRKLSHSAPIPLHNVLRFLQANLKESDPLWQRIADFLSHGVSSEQLIEFDMRGLMGDVEASKCVWNLLTGQNNHPTVDLFYQDRFLWATP